MKVGFTAPRIDMSRKQLHAIEEFLTKIGRGPNNEFHHGDCIGGDEQAFIIAANLEWKTIAHPCTLSMFRANTASDVILEPYPPLARNRIIVDTVTTMLAAPNGVEVLRSGTWMTIRYAIQKGKLPESHIIYP